MECMVVAVRVEGRSRCDEAVDCKIGNIVELSTATTVGTFRNTQALDFHH